MTETEEKPLEIHLNPSHKAVLNFLKAYRHPWDNNCTPSTREIAEGVKLSPGRVRAIVEELVTLGALEKWWPYFADYDGTLAYARKKEDASSCMGDLTPGRSGIRFLFKVLFPSLILALFLPLATLNAAPAPSGELHLMRHTRRRRLAWGCC